jgi:hypothetical protein
MRTLTLALVASALFCRMALAADAPTVRFDGLVAHPQSFGLADLKAMPPRQVDASFGTMHGQEHHAWTGVLLLDLIGKAGPKDDSGKNPSLRHTILVHGKDGYAVALADGEIDPMAENKQVILAYRRDGDAGDLPGLRLVVPGDQHGARQVHDVVEVEIR